MDSLRRQLLIMLLVVCVGVFENRASPAGVRPYLQNPASDAMTVIWFTETNTAGTLTVNLPAGGTQVIHSTPEQKSELAYHPAEALTSRLNSPWMHRIRVTGLSELSKLVSRPLQRQTEMQTDSQQP